MITNGDKKHEVKRLTVVYSGSNQKLNCCFILDSGASAHCCNNRDLFLNLIEDETVLSTISGYSAKSSV